MIEKIISILLTPLLFLNTMIPFLLGNRNEKTIADPIPTNLHSVGEYVDFVRENGAPAYSTEVFVQQVEPFFEMMRVLSGRPLASEEEKHLNAHIDEKLSMICGYIAENTGFDIELLFRVAPNLNRPAELANEVFQFDAAAMRTRVYELRDQAYDEGNDFLAAMMHLFAAYWSVIREVNVYTEPYGDNPEHLRVMMDITYDDGTHEDLDCKVIIDPESGEVYGIHEGRGMLDLGFDANIYDLITFSTVNSWQRALGYDLLFDVMTNASAFANLDTRRFKFDYCDKEWMIQIWKGNYVQISNGFEIGIYNRPAGSFGTYYSAAADDEMMPLAAKLYHGDELLMEKSAEKHWWMSAFKINKVLYLPDTLTLEFSITFPNEEMLGAFTAAVDNHGAEDVTYRVDGLTFHGTF